MRADTQRFGRRLFNDLLSLEINTITKSGMTARKMPDPAVALHEIATTYRNVLATPTREAAELLAIAPPAAVVPTVEDPPFPPLPETFEFLAEGAREAGESTVNGNAEFDESGDATPPLDAGRLVLLRRIAGNSDRLREIVERANSRNDGGGDLVLTPDEAVELRKIWEVNAETVVMQTIVQVDGDAISRVLRDERGLPSASLQTFHRAMVSTSVDYWTSLARAAGELLRSLPSFFRHTG